MWVCRCYRQCDVLTDHLMNKKHRKNIRWRDEQGIGAHLEKFFTLFRIKVAEDVPSLVLQVYDVGGTGFGYGIQLLYNGVCSWTIGIVV